LWEIEVAFTHSKAGFVPAEITGDRSERLIKLKCKEQLLVSFLQITRHLSEVWNKKEVKRKTGKAIQAKEEQCIIEVFNMQLLSQL
jgi:hypothetical protein